MPIRPRTNAVTPSSNMCCEPTAPLDCSRYEPFMGPDSPTAIRFRLEAGACANITAFDLSGITTLSIYRVDGGECASGLRVPYVRCGSQVVMTVGSPSISLCGPGWFEAQSSATAGQVLAQIEFINAADSCCEDCPPSSGATTDPCEVGQAVVNQGINWNQLISRDGSGCLQYGVPTNGVPTNGEVDNTLTGVPFITFTTTGIGFLPAPFCEAVNNCVTFPPPPSACSIGAGVPAGTIVALVGVNNLGCLVKQNVEVVEFRDCANVLLFNAYKII